MSCLMFTSRRGHGTYVTVVTCVFMVCLICTPSALGPVAFRLWVHCISGKPLMSMLHTTTHVCITCRETIAFINLTPWWLVLKALGSFFRWTLISGWVHSSSNLVSFPWNGWVLVSYAFRVVNGLGVELSGRQKLTMKHGYKEFKLLHSAEQMLSNGWGCTVSNWCLI